MKGEEDLMAAILDIGAADTGTGSLVNLTGKSTPIVPWDIFAEEETETKPPILACDFDQNNTRLRRVKGDSQLIVPAVVDAFVTLANPSGLEVDLIDRVEDVMTHAEFNSQGLDVAPTPGPRRRLSNLEQGRRRFRVRYTLMLRR